MLYKRIKIVFISILIFLITIAEVKDVYAEDNVITPPVVDIYSYWNEAPIGNEYDVTFASSETTLIIPIEITINGGLHIMVFISSFDAMLNGMDVQDKNYKALTVALYKDKECKESMLISNTLIKGNTAINSEVSVDKGVYYLKYDLIRDKSKGSDNDLTFSSYIAQVGSEDRVLTKGIDYAIYQDTSTGKHRYKFVMDEDGYAKFYAESFREASNVLKIQLLDSCGNPITDETSEVGYAATETDYIDWNGGIYKAYLLNIGTYYIQVSANCGLFYLRYDNLATSDTSGVSKNSAKKLTIGKGISGVITLNDKKTKVDWYKFTLKSTKSLSIVFDSINPTSDNIIPLPYDSSTGYAKLTIINSDGKIVYQKNHLSLSKKTILNNVEKQLVKGTYYVKISKELVESYGDYKLTIK